MTPSNAPFTGSQADCQQFIRDCVRPHYVYVLRRPDGRPFYVGKGGRDRAFAHENEARHPNDWRSNAYKLNVIRSIWRDGGAIIYEIDFITDDEAAAYAREAALIGQLKRLHEGGPLTNLAPGGGSLQGAAPASKARHSATLGGAPTDNPERAILNRFVLGIATMRSVVIKPSGQFVARPTLPYPQKSMELTLRQAVALAAAAAANGVFLSETCVIPRRVTVEGVNGLVENGVACDIITSGSGALISAPDPGDEAFRLSSDQARAVVGWVGLRKCVDLGVMPASAFS
jgi:hypothetical protein